MSGDTSARLIFTAPATDEVVVVTGQVTIGRSRDNDVHLDDPEVSRHHARLVAQNGTFTIEDLGSQNGTFVNERLITTSSNLSDGDQIAFAGVQATFHVSDPEASSSPDGPPDAPESSSLPRAALEHPGAQGVLLVRPVTTFGRAADNDIILDDPAVSVHHAKILWDTDRFTLVDLGSANGTYLNEQPVTTPCLLQPGDEIRLGDRVFIFRRLLPARRANRLR